MNNAGPGVMPWIINPANTIAVAGSPGMPRESKGISVPPVTALFAVSGAITPSMLPLPKLLGVFENIMNNASADEWYEKGKESLKRGSPMSAHLIWLQCLNSPNLSLKEVFQFELNLAIQVTRIGDFKEGIRALIIDKDNKPKWKYGSISKVSKEWIDKHTELAWRQNPLEDL